MLDVTLKHAKMGVFKLISLNLLILSNKKKNNILTLLKNKLLLKHYLKVFVPSWQENSINDFILQNHSSAELLSQHKFDLLDLLIGFNEDKGIRRIAVKFFVSVN
jgi:hypothetical protein